MNASKRVSALRAEAAIFGWPKLLLSRVIQRALNLFGIYLASVRATPIDLARAVPAMPSHIKLTQLTADDLAAIADDCEMDISSTFITAALARGDFAFGAYDGECLVAYVWRAINSFPPDEGVALHFEKPYSYLYKSFTRPSHRGQRLTPNLFRYADQQFMQMGYTHRCAYIHVCNLASIRSAKSIGSQFLGYAGYLQWFGRKHFFRTPAVKRVGIAFSAR